MFEIKYRGQALQVMQLKTYGTNAIEFYAAPCEINPICEQVRHGFIQLKHNQTAIDYISIEGYRVDAEMLTRCIPADVFPGVLWVRTPCKVTRLGLFHIDCYDGTGYHAIKVSAINYAHQLSDYFSDKRKRYDISKKFAGVTSIVLEDGSELLRCWTIGDFKVYYPSWMYRKNGGLHTSVDCHYQDGL